VGDLGILDRIVHNELSPTLACDCATNPRSLVAEKLPFQCPLVIGGITPLDFRLREYVGIDDLLSGVALLADRVPGVSAKILREVVAVGCGDDPFLYVLAENPRREVCQSPALAVTWRHFDE